MKRLALLLVGVMCVIFTSAQSFTERVERSGLVIYYPGFSRVDLVCGTMPSKQADSVIFCAEAAYTHALLTDFSHANIDGDHVSGGVFYAGAPCTETPQRIGNTGVFVWYAGRWQFAMGESTDLLHEAAAKGGMGFSQAIIYWNGEQQKTTRGTLKAALEKTTHYRVLAELEGRLCIIDSKLAVPYADFLEMLEQIRPTYAIYCDMGHGWNYSWYRDSEGRVHEIHPTPGRYTTNWITFYTK